jgi:hypothetical protein
MEDALSSQSGRESGNDSSEGNQIGPGSYETLEDYIYNTSRKDWDETRKSIRMEEWMLTFMKKIRIKENTNSTEIVARAYLMGLYNFREEHGEESYQLQKLLVNFFDLINESSHVGNDQIERMEDIYEVGIEQNKVEDGELAEPKAYRIKKSALAEAEDNYVTGGLFGGWLHRLLVSFGLLESRHTGNEVEKTISSYQASLELTVEQAREEVESLFKDFLGTKFVDWRTDGVDEETINLAQNVVESMETERKEKCEAILEDAYEFTDND